MFMVIQRTHLSGQLQGWCQPAVILLELVWQSYYEYWSLNSETVFHCLMARPWCPVLGTVLHYTTWCFDVWKFMFFSNPFKLVYTDENWHIHNLKNWEMLWGPCLPPVTAPPHKFPWKFTHFHPFPMGKTGPHGFPTPCRALVTTEHFVIIFDVLLHRH